MTHRCVEFLILRFANVCSDVCNAITAIKIFNGKTDKNVIKYFELYNFVKQIGTIPEAIEHDSTEEKLYSKALENNVCLLAWEHISIMLDRDIKENEKFSLESLWNSSQMIARDKTLAFANAKSCFLPKIDGYVAKKAGMTKKDFLSLLGDYKNIIINRGEIEIEYWNDCIVEIKRYTREEAIEELIKAKKLYEKISVISTYIEKLKR